MSPVPTRAFAATYFLLAGNARAEAPLELERWIVPRHLSTIDQAFDAAQNANSERLPLTGDAFSKVDITAIDALFRARIILTAPADGDYRFAIAGDDLARLYFSPESTPLKKRPVAKVAGYTGVHAWRSFPSQISEPVTLVKGQSYYLEAHCFNQGGGGHFEVGWQLPGGKEIEPMPLMAADGTALLTAYQVPASDSDDDELPDEWERAKGLEIGKNRLHGADGDPDGDSSPNRRELVEGTDPLKGDATAGAVRTEVWAGRGNIIWDQLFRYGAHLLPLPAPVVAIEKSIAVPPFATPGFQRTRGFIIPPASGMYRFHLEGQGLVGMDLSPDDDALKRWPIIRGGSVSDEVQAGQVPPGRFPASEPVFLKQGERFFFETLLYQNRGDYFLKLEWTKPDGSREELPMQALQSYSSPFLDADQDDLPDDWEKSKGLEIDGRNPKHFASGDPDTDGADNAAERLANTDPLQADSDGDGASDGEEIRLLGTNPLQADSPLLKSLPVDFFSAKPLNPGWSRADPEHYENHRNMPGPLPDYEKSSLSIFRGHGSLEWKFAVEEAGFHLLRFPIQPVSIFPTQQIGIHAEIRIDGILLPKVTSYGSAMSLQTISQLGPWLSKGEHTLRLSLSSAFMPAMTRVFGVEILPVKPGPATEAVKSHLLASNRFTAGTGESLTSPASITFQSRYEGPLELTVGGKVVAMSAGQADVNLPEDGKPLELKVTTESGPISTNCRWLTTNVIGGRQLTIRAGDSLRLGAADPDTGESGQATLEALGQSKGLAAGEVWVEKFPASGTHKVKARLVTTSGKTIEGVLEVTVVAAPATIAPVLARVGSATTIPALPKGLAIDGGKVADITAAADGTLQISPRSAGDFLLSIRVNGDGAVAGLIPLKAFSIRTADEPSWTGRENEQPPGRQVHLVMENLPEDASVRMSCLDPELYAPYASEAGKPVEFAVRHIGPEGLATIHVRAVKDAYQWLRTELRVILPDGREY